MKKTALAFVILILIGLAFSSCKTQERCDAYKPARNHSRY